MKKMAPKGGMEEVQKMKEREERGRKKRGREGEESEEVIAIIESSKSTDIGTCYGLSFLWNAESPRNLQQTKAE